MTEYTVAIVGRPNVGKSTLFNRLIGKKHAIVDDMPGVTRDWREGNGNIGPLEFKVIDTAGLEEEAKTDLAQKVKKVTINALEHTHLILFITDAKTSVTSHDLLIARWLLKSKYQVVLVVNKSESANTAVFIEEYYRLGLGEPVFISAEHGLGTVDLHDRISAHKEEFLKDKEQSVDIKTDNNPISIAIVGRPNAGKSTLVNQLLQKERVVTADLPGTTRDSITLDFEFSGLAIKLVDTAGLKKKNSIKNKLEEMTYDESKHAIRFAHTVILMLDATSAFESQDIAIANMVIEEGRSLIVAVNKWDKINNKSEYNNALSYSISKLVPEIKDVPIIYISASNGHNVHLLMRAAIECFENWNIRISTSKLNSWLNQAIEAHPLPLAANAKKVKIKYITQHNVRPPAFVLFSNLPDEIDQSYIRYLANNLKKDFKLFGVPVRIHCKKVNNPYTK